jgi:hypothetical protein
MKTIIGLAIALTFAGCNKESDPEPTRHPPSEPATGSASSNPTIPAVQEAGNADDLRRQMEALLGAVKAKNMDEVEAGVLGMAMTPDDAKPWFERSFGPDVGGRVAKEWEDDVFANLPKLVRPFKQAVEDGRTEVRVVRIASASDANATGAQKAAFAAMKAPVVLYTVKLVEPGKDSGTSLWSFAYIDGGFRFLGEMKAAKG